MKNFKDTCVFWFIKNICAVFRCDIYKDLKEVQNKCDILNRKIYFSQNKQKIINYYFLHPEQQKKYMAELAYIVDNDNIIFPYKKEKCMGDILAKYDDANNMCYVIHQGKRLYFPTSISMSQAIQIYKNYIEEENILGGGYKEKSPHQYESDFCHVEKGDILFDVGCAEALFTLHNIEIVKKAYVIESDSMWNDALHKTFEPYKDKVVWVNKCVSTEDSPTNILFSELLSNISCKEHIFIKMDIEGNEFSVLQSFVKESSKRQIKISCCTYHKQYDFENINCLMKTFGYTTEISDGYMLFFLDDGFDVPFFRHGILRCKNY